MFKTALVMAGLLVGLSFTVAAPANPGGTNARCQPGIEGHPGGCIDPIGDASGIGQPDIARVTEFSWGVIAFRVTFANGSRLGHSPAFTDKVSVTLTAIGKTTKRYRLTVTARDLTREVLRRLPTGQAVTLPLTANALWLGKSVTLAVDLHQIGNPTIVRFTVEAARVILDGTTISSDSVPNKGTMVWHAEP